MSLRKENGPGVGRSLKRN